MGHAVPATLPECQPDLSSHRARPPTDIRPSEPEHELPGQDVHVVAVHVAPAIRIRGVTDYSVQLDDHAVAAVAHIPVLVPIAPAHPVLASTAEKTVRALNRDQVRALQHSMGARSDIIEHGCKLAAPAQLLSHACGAPDSFRRRSPIATSPRHHGDQVVDGIGAIHQVEHGVFHPGTLRSLRGRRCSSSAVLRWMRTPAGDRTRRGSGMVMSISTGSWPKPSSHAAVRCEATAPEPAYSNPPQSRMGVVSGPGMSR